MSALEEYYALITLSKIQGIKDELKSINIGLVRRYDDEGNSNLISTSSCVKEAISELDLAMSNLNYYFVSLKEGKEN